MLQSPPSKIPTGIWILGYVSLLMDISSEMIHSLLPLYLVVHLHASTLTLGLIEGIAESAALIIKVFSGALSDYMGKRKPLALFGYGLSALSKPLFAIAGTVDMVFSARLIDRVGKGIRGAPRDALIADITPLSIQGAAYGLRQSMDTVGALLGPLLAIVLMLLWDNHYQWVFWAAAVPSLLAVLMLWIGVHETEAEAKPKPKNSPIKLAQLRQLSSAYWWVVVFGGLFTLARFSEAFLVLFAQKQGLPIAYAPLIMVVMSAIYALSAYPFGKLADRMPHTPLLVLGILALIVADLLLASLNSLIGTFLGIIFWGLHMGITQGLLATMVAQSVTQNIRGTAFGIFNLVSGLCMLVASTLAGLIWHHWGATYTFYVGASFSVLALLVLLGAYLNTHRLQQISAN